MKKLLFLAAFTIISISCTDNTDEQLQKEPQSIDKKDNSTTDGGPADDHNE